MVFSDSMGFQLPLLASALSLLSCWHDRMNKIIWKIADTRAKIAATNAKGFLRSNSPTTAIAPREKRTRAESPSKTKLMTWWFVRLQMRRISSTNDQIATQMKKI
ncbi:hypothetical protein ASPWEDRAFT_42850 [Aspergillus wentii DTO 134E9]|uniref:Secreted protein n=1 Tax=Aspergillus wentii DTO 134E9 TaxID=1073089 RepID=A0A1L9RD29_ASPWE|nr:uncharacterized protein ASPWEDRAFT_42850 [Aspergillus wentii DTO 134E9]OJJ32821.1 hypothetical protein ASPWEDRAFT_42850 [Aspergillus wentii DTO 134E9]